MIFSNKAIRSVCATLTASACVAAASTVYAQPPQSLRDALFGAPGDERAFTLPPVGRFQSESGDGFVLDRTAGRPVFMKYEDSAEIWALNPTPGPRGDIIYKDDTGQPVLRATRLGGLTLFTPDQPGGAAAALAGPAPSIRMPPLASPNALLQSFSQASVRAGRAIQRSITFEAKDVPITAAPLFADAAGVTAEAFVEVAERNEEGRKLAARFAKVQFDAGKAPAAAAAGQTMRITIAPEWGLAGRPSSHRVAVAIGRR